jgi:transcriptional regulator with XRE-family HTH domain
MPPARRPKTTKPKMDTTDRPRRLKKGAKGKSAAPKAKASKVRATAKPTSSSGAKYSLEQALGSQVREFRKRLGATVHDLAKQAEMSSGMLSKIENGQTSPSLGTLQRLSKALNIPVTTFFRKYEEQRDATHLRAGAGLKIERRGTRSGHHYRLLGSSMRKNVSLEPYIVYLTKRSEVFPIFQHSGLEFIYMLEGEMDYHHNGATYNLRSGDSLFFETDAPHGPEKLVTVPIRFICTIANSPFSEE